MKTSEIEVGKVYTNGKGKLYQVYDIIPGYPFPHVLYTYEHEGPNKGKTNSQSLHYFAGWAKSEVKEDA